MKRFIAMLLILCSALLMTAAFAENAAPEAKITVVEQRFINMEDDGRGFFFAKVQNTATLPVTLIIRAISSFSMRMATSS